MAGCCRWYYPETMYSLNYYFITFKLQLNFKVILSLYSHPLSLLRWHGSTWISCVEVELLLSLSLSSLTFFRNGNLIYCLNWSTNKTIFSLPSAILVSWRPHRHHAPLQCSQHLKIEKLNVEQDHLVLIAVIVPCHCSTHCFSSSTHCHMPWVNEEP